MIETFRVLLSAIPLGPDDRFGAVEIGAAGHEFARAFAARFPHASLLSLEQAERASPLPVQRVFGPGELVRRPFDAATVDWWDVLFGAAVVVAPNGLGALNDAKKQFVFKAAVDRMVAPTAIAIADELAPGTLLHYLVWLKHAGLSMVDCFAREERMAVFGGWKA